MWVAAGIEAAHQHLTVVALTDVVHQFLHVRGHLRPSLLRDRPERWPARTSPAWPPWCASITLAPKASTTVTVTFSAPKKAAPSLSQAHLVLGDSTHAALFAALG
ncbi:hypothetical protein [Aestuariimicrobium ganziense]|uniref:hypothetical protein n=1 Tax=Aestuariimicrobium ganziense TaxID=2773677 RepID=UPI001940CCFE|nr:hypothetical protein [Aestuariimicrobium ganziense]